LEKSIGELGGRCLEYPKTGGTIGGIIDWFKGVIQALPSTFTEANRNIICFAVADILSRKLVVGMCLSCKVWLLLGMRPC
jgi:hypothetical protein